MHFLSKLYNLTISTSFEYQEEYPQICQNCGHYRFQEGMTQYSGPVLRAGKKNENEEGLKEGQNIVEAEVEAQPEGEQKEELRAGNTLLNDILSGGEIYQGDGQYQQNEYQDQGEIPQQGQDGQNYYDNQYTGEQQYVQEENENQKNCSYQISHILSFLTILRIMTGQYTLKKRNVKGKKYWSGKAGRRKK